MKRITILSICCLVPLFCCQLFCCQYCQAQPAPNDAGKTKPSAASPEISYDIYRDKNVYPLDSRKPCNPCVQVSRPNPIPGLHGQPYLDRIQGECKCGKKRCCKHHHPDFSVYWPRPFSFKQNERHPGLSGDTRKPRIQDVFDGLKDFKLIDYKRTDDGHCGDFFGSGRDRYGCLGESRHGNIACLQTRSPGQPVTPAIAPKSLSYPLN